MHSLAYHASRQNEAWCVFSVYVCCACMCVLCAVLCVVLRAYAGHAGGAGAVCLSAVTVCLAPEALRNVSRCKRSALT